MPRSVAASPGCARIARGAELMAARGGEFRRTAERFSSSRENAEDALARATEILLSKAPQLEPPQLRAWMHTVTRREAIAIRRRESRAPRVVAAAGEAPLEPDSLPSGNLGPEAELERREAIARAAEQLARLKPQERRALALRGAGCSYAEIQAITGWTYTKVNRCIAEGRAALRAHAPLTP